MNFFFYIFNLEVDTSWIHFIICERPSNQRSIQRETKNPSILSCLKINVGSAHGATEGAAGSSL